MKSGCFFLLKIDFERGDYFLDDDDYYKKINLMFDKEVTK